MNTKLFSIVSAAILTVCVGAANAEAVKQSADQKPMQLSAAQMDNVTAGAPNLAFAGASALALGARSFTFTGARTSVILGGGSASQSVSVSAVW